MDAPKDWFWEGNVVETLAHYLSNEGWAILSQADTYSKQQGVDIHARLKNVTLLVEVKGYPSDRYRDPRRANEQKRTNPTLQAQHWYSQALLKALRLQGAHPEAQVALALPDFPRYQSLIAETRGGLEKLGVVIFTVQECGKVQVWGIDQHM